MAKITKQTAKLLDFLCSDNIGSFVNVGGYGIERKEVEHFIKNNLNLNDILKIKKYQNNQERYIHNPRNKDIYKEHAEIEEILNNNNLNRNYYGFKNIDETIEYLKKEYYKTRKNNNTNNKSRDKEGYVYLIKQGEYYKIGKTLDLKSRFKKYVTENPNECELIHSYLVPEYGKEEKRLHKRFASKNHNREWFLLDDDDVEYIKNIKLI